jgi:4-amino-4-deoxy-L-arabinose transferase-like glycosyltransferase
MGLLLSVLLVISTLVRMPLLNQVPPELFGDEIDVGYQAYSLFKTGQDLYRQPLPTYIHSLSEWRAPLIMYMTVPSLAALGNTEYGVRLPEAVFGSLSPIILFLLIYQLTHSRSISFFSGLALALMPWHIYYSRAAFEVVFLINFLMLGTLLYLKRRDILSLLFFALAFYTYSTATVFVPLFFLALVLINRRLPSLKSILISIVILSPFALNLFTGHAQQRFGLLSIFGYSEVIDKITFLRSQFPSIWETFFHNKGESYLFLFGYNYLRAFSTDFLFVRGDPVFRHGIQIIGQLLPVTSLFFFTGLYVIIRRRYWLLAVWLALAPVSSALTYDGAFHATRLFLMVVPVAFCIGVGFCQLAEIIHHKKFKLGYYIITGVVFLWSFTSFAHYYLVHYPSLSSRWWAVGYKSVLTQLPSLESGYHRVFINNTYEPALIRFLFYSNYPPEKFHRYFIIDQPQADIVPNYDGFTLDGKFYFGDFTQSAKSRGFNNYLLPDSLYLISQRDNVPGNWDWRISHPKGLQVLYTAVNANNEPIFYLIAKQ